MSFKCISFLVVVSLVVAEGMTMSSLGTYCIFLKLPWDEAITACFFIGGQPAVISLEYEAQVVEDLVKQ